MATPAARPAGGRGGRSHRGRGAVTTFASTAPRRIAVASADGATPLTTLARIGAAGEPSTWQVPRFHRSRGSTCQLPAHWHREVAGKAHPRCPLSLPSASTTRRRRTLRMWTAPRDLPTGCGPTAKRLKNWGKGGAVRSDGRGCGLWLATTAYFHMATRSETLGTPISEESTCRMVIDSNTWGARA
jgi:hypothetical protein